MAAEKRKRFGGERRGVSAQTKGPGGVSRALPVRRGVPARVTLCRRPGEGVPEEQDAPAIDACILSNQFQRRPGSPGNRARQRWCRR